jgi:hypothetical protein
MQASPPGASTLDFEQLDDLRLYLEGFLRLAVSSMEKYWSHPAGGFTHIRNQQKEKGDFSKTSTATCVAFLVRTERWSIPNVSWEKAAPVLLKAIVKSDWDSADLKPGNPFTTAFLLEAIADLQLVTTDRLSEDVERGVTKRREGLEAELKRGTGIKVGTFPATSFMTQKVLRTVARYHKKLPPEIAGETARFAWGRLREESISLSMEEPDADVYELGYAALIASQTTELHDMSPRERDSLMFAIDQFFRAQRPDGTWPRSQPLFLYPEYGNAYCYDYEFLVQLLSDPQLQPMLLSKMPELRAAAQALGRRKIPIGAEGQVGWASGNLKRETTEPESWSTASAFHFCDALHRLIAESIRRSLFHYVRRAYPTPAFKAGSGKLSSEFLDTPVDVGGKDKPVSLVRIVNEKFLAPLVANTGTVKRGQPFPKDVRTSAILYGPPGTSKTKLAGLIADGLGWPLLTLDPSHVTRKGFDALHEEANRIFTMLEATEQIVVLLDEFDELVLSRDEQGSESESRFLTTAMLPKLAALSDRRRIVYLLATNHLERFDAAISREGRFDMILPVAPPTLAAKLKEWPEFGKAARAVKLDLEASARDDPMVVALADLTYNEFERLTVSVANETDRGRFDEQIAAFSKRSTLAQAIPGSKDRKTWKDRMKEQQERIRPWELV